MEKCWRVLPLASNGRALFSSLGLQGRCRVGEKSRRELELVMRCRLQPPFSTMTAGPHFGGSTITCQRNKWS